MKKHVYADNAATSQVSKSVIDAMIPYLYDQYGNASQPYSFARKPKNAIKEARKMIADCIGAQPEEIFFTSGGSESNNWVIRGAIQQHLPIITSPIEHNSVLRPSAVVGNTKYLDVDKDGIVHVSYLDKLFNNVKGLVSVMYANNEIGTIEPINQLVDYTHRAGWLFHTDAVQAIGHIPINVQELGIDFLSASAHKFNGPKGIGFLYKRKGVSWPALILGGSQEFGNRAGTENVASVVGMAVALEENNRSIDSYIRYINNLEKNLLDLLLAAKISFKRNGSVKHIPGNISLSFPNKNGESILHRLDLLGISISTGSACDSQNTQISHVLKAIKLDEKYAKGTIRISLSHNNTQSDVEFIADAIIKTVT